MPPSVQLSLGPLQVKRVDGVSSEREGEVNEVDRPAVDADLRALSAEIVTATVGDEPLKAVADKGQVSRWKQGDNPTFTRLIASEDRRKRMARALLKSCRGVRLREVFEIEEIA